MNITLTSRFIISLTAAILMIAATTLPQVALAQGNFTTPAKISNSQNVSPSDSTTATNATPANFLTYENSTWGIKIQYPSNWVKQTSGQGVTFAVLPNGTNGNNEIKIVYSYTDPKNTNFNATDIATIKNNRLYVIQYYYVQSSTYQDVLQTLQKMVNSFQISG